METNTIKIIHEDQCQLSLKNASITDKKKCKFDSFIHSTNKKNI
jgi:hypothetical protein